MKAVVLARGKGTRMRQNDETASLQDAQADMAAAGVKAMIPFRRPFLDYVLSALADAGGRDVCLVVAPDDTVIRRYYTEIRPPERIRVAFAIQEQPRGTADAILAAGAFAGADPFLVLNADNYYPAPVFRALIDLDGPGLPAFRRSALTRDGNFEPERVRAYAILEIGADGYLDDIIEKPDDDTAAAFGEDYFVSMNCWRFDASIFPACRAIASSPRGELELPNAVRFAIRAQGHRFRAVPIEAAVLDLSRRSDIPEVERRLAALDPRP
jgi:dTDP-glucose pyrophosphorylase